MLMKQYMYLKKKNWKQKLIKPMFSNNGEGDRFAKAQKSTSPGGNFKCVVKWILNFSESLDVIFACHMLE